MTRCKRRTDDVIEEYGQMDLHQLRYVLAIAEEENFTRAAAKLYLSQPSLSVQVRKLEQELGTPLFTRLGRRVALTAAGDAFVGQARKVLFEVEEARRRVDEALHRAWWCRSRDRQRLDC